jgi:DNA-directed RNA polymerase I subunit RPA49
MMDRRADLGQTFGTKKAKKALEDAVLNAISPSKKNGDNTPTKIDNSTRAILGSVGEIASTMTSREDLQAIVDAAKPVPKANLEADEIQDVYDPKNIIGSDILNLVPIREWQEKAKHKDSIQVSSRYVAARVNAIASSEESVTRLRVLRYLYFVLLFWLHTKPGRQRDTRQLPPREKLKEALQPAPEAVIENIRRKFSDAGTLRKFHTDLLIAHCCVFACIVDNFEVDTQNLKDDLKLEQKKMNQYFHEIGARVRQVSNKAEGRTTHVARLALPLKFPQQRHFNPKRR